MMISSRNQTRTVRMMMMNKRLCFRLITLFIFSFSFRVRGGTVVIFAADVSESGISYLVN